LHNQQILLKLKLEIVFHEQKILSKIEDDNQFLKEYHKTAYLNQARQNLEKNLVLSEKQKNVQELQRTQVTNFSVDALAHIP
jgi:hypothetical protein